MSNDKNETRGKTRSIRVISKLPSLEVLAQSDQYAEVLPTDNNKLYFELRRAVELQLFEVRDGYDWPVVELGDPRKPVGIVEIAPPLALLSKLTRDEKTAWQQRTADYLKKLGPEAADILDALAFYYHQRQNQCPEIGFSTDDFLALRGIQKRLGGSHVLISGEEKPYRGGYEPKARARVSELVMILASLCFSRVKIRVFKDADGKKLKRPEIFGYEQRQAVLLIKEISQQFDSGGYTGFNEWTILPGANLTRAFAEGMVVELPRGVFRLNPVKYAYEKALTRHLYYHWRVRIKNHSLEDPFVIRDLLIATGLNISNSNRPGQTQKRFIQALQRLVAEGIIVSSDFDHWEDGDENRSVDHPDDDHPIGLGRRAGEHRPRGWIELWAEERIRIKPLPHIFKMQERLHPKKLKTKSDPLSKVVADAKDLRLKKGLSVEVAAGQIGIKPGLLKNLEAGHFSPYPPVEARLIRWVKTQGS